MLQNFVATTCDMCALVFPFNRNLFCFLTEYLLQIVYSLPLVEKTIDGNFTRMTHINKRLFTIYFLATALFRYARCSHVEQNC